MKRALAVLLVTLSARALSDVTHDRVKQLQDTLAELQRENGRLVAQCDLLTKENGQLWTEVGKLAQEIRDVQQYTRIDNVEITGMPQRPGENIYELLEKICATLDIPYNRDEISEAHRLPKGRQGPPFIVVRFVSRRSRDRWLAASRAGNCDVRRVFPDMPAAPFYVNQHLTSYKKALLDMAKRLVNEGVFAFTWVKDGKIYARRTVTSHVIRIRTFEDFNHENEAIVRTRHSGSKALNKTHRLKSRRKHTSVFLNKSNNNETIFSV